MTWICPLSACPFILAGVFFSFRPSVCFLHIIVVAHGWQFCLYTFLLEQRESCYTCLLRTLSSSFCWQKSPDTLACHSRPSVTSQNTCSAVWLLALPSPVRTLFSGQDPLRSSHLTPLTLSCQDVAALLSLGEMLVLPSLFCIHWSVHLFCSHGWSPIFVPEPGLHITYMEMTQTAVVPALMGFQGKSQVMNTQETHMYKLWWLYEKELHVVF